MGTSRAGRCRIIEQDFTREQRRDFTVRKEILWESETVAETLASAIEVAYIRELRSNDPSSATTGGPSTRARPERDVGPSWLCGGTGHVRLGLIVEPAVAAAQIQLPEERWRDIARAVAGGSMPMHFSHDISRPVTVGNVASGTERLADGHLAAWAEFDVDERVTRLQLS